MQVTALPTGTLVARMSDSRTMTSEDFVLVPQGMPHAFRAAALLSSCLQISLLADSTAAALPSLGLFDQVGGDLFEFRVDPAAQSATAVYNPATHLLLQRSSPLPPPPEPPAPTPPAPPTPGKPAAPSRPAVWGFVFVAAGVVAALLLVTAGLKLLRRHRTAPSPQSGRDDARAGNVLLVAKGAQAGVSYDDQAGADYVSM